MSETRTPDATTRATLVARRRMTRELDKVHLNEGMRVVCRSQIALPRVTDEALIELTRYRVLLALIANEICRTLPGETRDVLNRILSKMAEEENRQPSKERPSQTGAELCPSHICPTCYHEKDVCSHCDKPEARTWQPHEQILADIDAEIADVKAELRHPSQYTEIGWARLNGRLTGLELARKHVAFQPDPPASAPREEE